MIDLGCYTDRGLDLGSRYLDEYRAEDARWRFARRRAAVDGLVACG